MNLRICPVREGYQKLEMPAERPCTLEQNRAALKITLHVHRGEITAAEGRSRLVELFGMPELEHER